MARILVFRHWNEQDSKLTTGGQPVPWALGSYANVVTNTSNPVPTLPVRCFSAGEETRYIGWEIGATVVSGETLAIQFWQEFYNDTPSLVSPPNDRDGHKTLGISASGWSRELIAMAASVGGVVNMLPVTRKLSLTLTGGDTGNIVWRYAPLSAHALWTRLRICVDISSSTSITAADLAYGTKRVGLVVYANIGGHDEYQYLAENVDTPYDYNAYKS